MLIRTNYLTKVYVYKSIMLQFNIERLWDLQMPATSLLEGVVDSGSFKMNMSLHLLFHTRFLKDILWSNIQFPYQPWLAPNAADTTVLLLTFNAETFVSTVNPMIYWTNEKEGLSLQSSVNLRITLVCGQFIPLTGLLLYQVFGKGFNISIVET